MNPKCIIGGGASRTNKPSSLRAPKRVRRYQKRLAAVPSIVFYAIAVLPAIASPPIALSGKLENAAVASMTNGGMPENLEQRFLVEIQRAGCMPDGVLEVDIDVILGAGPQAIHVATHRKLTFSRGVCIAAGYRGRRLPDSELNIHIPHSRRGWDRSESREFTMRWIPREAIPVKPTIETKVPQSLPEQGEAKMADSTASIALCTSICSLLTAILAFWKKLIRKQ